MGGDDEFDDIPDEDWMLLNQEVPVPPTRTPPLGLTDTQHSGNVVQRFNSGTLSSVSGRHNFSSSSSRVQQQSGKIFRRPLSVVGTRQNAQDTVRTGPRHAWGIRRANNTYRQSLLFNWRPMITVLMISHPMPLKAPQKGLSLRLCATRKDRLKIFGRRPYGVAGLKPRTLDRPRSPQAAHFGATCLQKSQLTMSLTSML